MNRPNSKIIIFSITTALFLSQTISANAGHPNPKAKSLYDFHYHKRYDYFPHKHRRKNYHSKHYYRPKHYNDRRDDHDYGEHYDYDHNFEFYGTVSSIPSRSITVSIGGLTIHYHKGIYYRNCKKHGYHIVKAPIGACIRHLPLGYDVHYHRGNRYYSYNDTYYKKTRDGYVVIETPHFELGYRHGYSDGIFFSFIR